MEEIGAFLHYYGAPLLSDQSGIELAIFQRTSIFASDFISGS